MIVKKREISRKILALEAILRRLPESHHKRQIIERDLSKYNSGYQGEKALNYYLSFIDENKYQIFHNLRLRNGEYFFQIDTLILTTSFALLIEVKNMSGKLVFEPEFNQLIRSIDEKEEGFPNPLLQIKRQQIQFEKWLDRHRYIPMPIEILVINSHSGSILKGNKFISKYVCKIDRVLEKIQELEKRYTTDILNVKEIRKIGNLLLKKDTPPNTLSLLKKYSISPSNIITGVQCPQCNEFPMVYNRRKWQCSKCRTISKDAHIKALQDYFNLFKNTISNTEFRQFLHIDSIFSASKLLNSLKLEKHGERKGRIYSPTKDFLQ
ncbi:NERD domain-containing protein [Bacillus sp. FJAT-49705]|uniref:NERD domain-containing protein n=1 Tax=Cytobacillus citreus TaxID=2833586 RepID=A0ABS5NW22_9BACI|nr:nuclease-related domain-containing protein [Cytobacillus citreus]MBS4192026.1 NERD domain-containing protein [Cytobacillus citreus]